MRIESPRNNGKHVVDFVNRVTNTAIAHNSLISSFGNRCVKSKNF